MFFYMLPFRKTGFVIRKILTWPFLVVLGLNIESFVTDRGLAELISEHWEGITPMLEEIYLVITSPYLLYPITFILGASLYEWMIFRAYEGSKFDGVSISKVTKLQAFGLIGPFREPGFLRRLYSSKNHDGLAYMNDLLEADGLPPIPQSFFSDEMMNKLFSQYLRMVSDGEREIAIKYYESIVVPTIDVVHPPQLPKGTTEETPR